MSVKHTKLSSGGEVGDISDKPKKYGFDWFKGLLKNKRFVAIIILLVGFVIFLTIFFMNPKESSKNTIKSTEDCAGDYYGKTIANLRETNAKELKIITDEIKQINKYDSSYDCLLPIIVSDAYKGDFESAKKHYSLLKTMAKENDKLDKNYSSAGYYKIKDLKALINRIEIRYKNIKENARYF
jgi:hypothetical protein